MPLRELLAEAVGGVPQAAPGRCVHERAGVATCRRCVAACPRDAWQVDDDELAIDMEQCDGCGLCVAACPEGALSQAGVSPSAHAGAPSVRLSCDRVEADAGDWRLCCVHAVGLAWLAALYGAGLRRIVLHVGDCEACDRHTDDGLPRVAGHLNDVLAQRQLPPITVRTLPARPGTGDADRQPARQAGPLVSRRGFLRQMVNATSLPNTDTSEAAWRPPGSRLRPARIGDLALFVPRIDLDRCNGCDACVRVCGHAALTCERGASDAYVIDPDACTGCGLCVDLCDRDAVSLGRGTVVSQVAIPLAVGRCSVCGVRFHRPDTGGETDTLCQVCSRVDHKRNLYQVL